MDDIAKKKSATEQTMLQVGPGESLQQGSSGATLQQGSSGAPFSMEQTAWLCEFLAKEKAGSPLSFAAPETSRNGDSQGQSPTTTGTGPLTKMSIPLFTPSGGASSLATRLVRRILELEFVEMSDLLPDSWLQEENQPVVTLDGQVLTSRRLPRKAQVHYGLNAIHLKRSRMLGPFPVGGRLQSDIQISRFGVIPKGHNEGKWRLITDLSYPTGHSVNDGINPALCSLRYTTVEIVASEAAALGPGALIAKVDIESAYRKTSNVDQISGYCDIDTEVGELRLPDDKVVHLRSLVADWAGRKACNRKELESLVGHLNHACKVVRPGRSFLRRMIALLQQYRNKYHPIRLNHGFRSDLHWWASFAAQWNGTSYIATGVQVRFATDASGNWGCGAWHQRSWFQWKWDDVTRLLAIAVKELLPIILATLVPQANKEPARVPQAAVDLLIIRDEVYLLKMKPPDVSIEVKKEWNLRLQMACLYEHLKFLLMQVPIWVVEFGAGADVLLGRSGGQLCPVTAILDYINVRRDTPGYFFVDSQEKPISKARFIAGLREALKESGYPDDQYAGHSFRIGAATAAPIAGVEDSLIQTLGRWHSAAFLR
eukprot:Em0024g474a